MSVYSCIASPYRFYNLSKTKLFTSKQYCAAICKRLAVVFTVQYPHFCDLFRKIWIILQILHASYDYCSLGRPVPVQQCRQVSGVCFEVSEPVSMGTTPTVMAWGNGFIIWAFVHSSHSPGNDTSPSLIQQRSLAIFFFSYLPSYYSVWTIPVQCGLQRKSLEGVGGWRRKKKLEVL